MMLGNVAYLGSFNLKENTGFQLRKIALTNMDKKIKLGWCKTFKFEYPRPRLLDFSELSVNSICTLGQQIKQLAILQRYSPNHRQFLLWPSIAHHLVLCLKQRLPKFGWKTYVIFQKLKYSYYLHLQLQSDMVHTRAIDSGFAYTAKNDV